MAFSINKTDFGGYLGDDPKITDLREGGRVANFYIAATESWTDKESQEKRERTEWMRVAVFSEPLIDLIEKSLHKGSKVLVSGSLQTRKYQKDGVDHYATEIVIKPYKGEIKFLDAPEPAKPAPDSRNNRRASSGPRPAA